MSADDQAFLDILSSVPNDIKRHSMDVADYIDKQVDKVANTIRDTLSTAQWLPESRRPRPPPPPPSSLRRSLPISSSTYSQIQTWISKHKLLTAVIVVALGGVTYHIIKRKSNRKKRRAKRAGNGARLEVVVVAGSPSEPITRSISLDLERRGFIVYIVCNTIEEEVLVQNESRADIRPLMIDIVDPESAHASIERFTAHLQTPHAAFQGAKPHHLTFRSLIIIPPQSYPSSPIATLAPSTLSDLLNTRLLTPVLTTQTFLPLLQSLPLPHPHQQSSPSATKPSILLLTPSIISSLSPPFHLPESASISYLTTFARTLSAELSPLKLPVTHLQLGAFDLSSFSPHSRAQNIQSQRAETLKWDDSTRSAYGRNFVALTSRNAVGKGSSLRELNNAVFDAMVEGRGGVVRVGMGSKLYGFVGNWVPSGLVAWMMGVRGVDREFGRKGDMKMIKDVERSPVSGLGESEYISVRGEGSGDDGYGEEESR